MKGPADSLVASTLLSRQSSLDAKGLALQWHQAVRPSSIANAQMLIFLGSKDTRRSFMRAWCYLDVASFWHQEHSLQHLSPAGKSTVNKVSYSVKQSETGSRWHLSTEHDKPISVLTSFSRFAAFSAKSSLSQVRLKVLSTPDLPFLANCLSAMPPILKRFAPLGSNLVWKQLQQHLLCAAVEINMDWAGC